MDDVTAGLERLYRERFGAFRNALAPVVGNYEDARDAVQEAFARALRARRSYRGTGSLQAWVWRIALRTALEQRRTGTRTSLGELDPELVEPDRQPALSAALRQLPPRKRVVVFLRYFADLSYAEIADACGISEGTVSATLTQARAALLEQLEAEGIKQ